VLGAILLTEVAVDAILWDDDGDVFAYRFVLFDLNGVAGAVVLAGSASVTFFDVHHGRHGSLLQ
jgi:hypothetical protein